MFRLFKRVVVLINNIENIDDLLKKGIEFANQHKKRLEVLFVHEKLFFSLPDYFFLSSSSKKNSLDIDIVESKIKKHIHFFDSNIKSNISVVEGHTLESVLNYAKDDNDILFICNYNKKVTQKLLEKTAFSYFIIKSNSLTYDNIIMPIKIDKSTKDDIKLIKDIFPKSTIEIVHDYYYKEPEIETDGLISVVTVVGNLDRELYQKSKERDKNLFENCKKEFNLQGNFMEEKKGLNIDLVEYIQSRDVDLIVIHHQEDEIFVSSVTFNLLDKVSSDFIVLNR